MNTILDYSMNSDDVINLFKCKIPIQIRFKDVDKQGHVNNANHLTYFETGRIFYFKEVFRKKIDWQHKGMILASQDITYKVPIFLEDNLFCYTRILKFGTKSFIMEHVLTTQKDGITTIVAFGKCTLVCINYETKQTITVPSEWVIEATSFDTL